MYEKEKTKAPPMADYHLKESGVSPCLHRPKKATRERVPYWKLKKALKMANARLLRTAVKLAPWNRFVQNLDKDFRGHEEKLSSKHAAVLKQIINERQSKRDERPKPSDRAHHIESSPRPRLQDEPLRAGTIQSRSEGPPDIGARPVVVRRPGER